MLTSGYISSEKKKRRLDCMKDVVLNEVKKELNEKEMRNALENICKYFNKDVSLIEKYNSKY